MDRFLGAEPGIESALDRALGADPDFALAHAAAARVHQAHGRGADARAAMERAVGRAERLTARERGHIGALAKVVAGDGPGALEAIRAHLAEFPRDVMLVMPCAGVFGLFGFSGRVGRERDLLAFLEAYAPHYGDDWWFLAAFAFAQGEAGRIDAARRNIERSLSLNPRNANGAHIRTHVEYEAGEDEAGLEWLERWYDGYDRAGLMHCHLGWHIALWNLDLGRREAAWRAYEALVRPGGAWGPPLNVVTDAASFLFRAELAGEPRSDERWREVARHARAAFPKPGLAFADAHVALACAMAGDDEALDDLIAGARGPAADMVVALARGFRAWTRRDWLEAVAALEPACTEHERIGGSRAQRDLIEYALLMASQRAGRRLARDRSRPLPANLVAARD